MSVESSSLSQPPCTLFLYFYSELYYCKIGEVPYCRKRVSAQIKIKMKKTVSQDDLNRAISPGETLF